MNYPADKFNYLVLVFAAALVISIFSRFSSDASGIQATLCFIMGAALFFNINAYSLKFKKHTLPLLLFMLVAVFSYYHSDFRYNARNGIFLLSYCGCAYLLSSFLKAYDKRSILLIPVFISLWLTIFLFATNITFSGLLEPQILSKTMRATAGFLVLALCLSFAFWWTERKIYTYTSFIIFGAILLTKSYYCAALASAAFAVFLFFMRDKLKIKPAVAILPFVALSSSAFYLAFKTGYFASKMPLWQTAASVIKDNFVLGTGFCNYQTVSEFYTKLPGVDMAQSDNLFLQLFAETGIAGLLLFISMLLVFFILIFKKLRVKENKTLYFPVLLSVIFFISVNMFESCAFISTNMLVLFIVLAFPADEVEVVKRKRKIINTYIAILMLLPLIYAFALPLLANEDYKKGIMFFAAGKYTVSEDYFLSAINRDAQNPDFTSKLSDTYFAMRQGENSGLLLDKAIAYKQFALSLNRYEGKYYYDLAWMYHAKGDKILASENIIKALEMDKFNEHFNDSYGALIY